MYLGYMAYSREAQKLQHVFPLCAHIVAVDTFFNNRDVWYLTNIYITPLIVFQMTHPRCVV